MPPPPDAGLPRPLAEVNADIRALVRAHGGTLSPEARREYARLPAEWAATVQGDVAGAA